MTFETEEELRKHRAEIHGDKSHGDSPSLREAGPHAEVARFSELPQALEEIEANAGSLTSHKA